MKRTIGLVTVHRTLNYGTMLQMYACDYLFRENGFSMQVIDYHRDCDYHLKDVETLWHYVSHQFRKASGLKTRLLNMLKAVLLYKDVKHFYHLCNSFMEKYVSLSRPYDSLEILRKNPPHADLYCAGSDQIWNSDYNSRIDPVYFLAFVEGRSKMAFASSIGKDNLTDEEKLVFNQYLSQFSEVSVREESAKELLASAGIDACSIIDPTLIVEHNVWDVLATKPVVDGDYLLLYKLKGNHAIDQIAHKIAKQKGLKVVRIAFNSLNLQKNEITVVLPEVSEFLSLIKNASYVVTNSFHGICFSINFQRDFTVLPRKQYNTRIDNILHLMGLQDRLCEGVMNPSCGTEIDYFAVNKKLKRSRVEACAWLSKTLKEV